jgi:5-methylcytosine-specific restriction endonuclease McrA
LVYSQSQICYYCKRTLSEVKQDIKENIIFTNRLSIDRKDSFKGYSLDNIVLACYRCNTIKGRYFTEREMLKLAKTLYKKGGSYVTI